MNNKLKITTKKSAIADIDTPLLVIGATEKIKEDSSTILNNKELKKIVDEIIKLGDFKGESGELLFTYTSGEIPAKRLLLIGLGKEEELTTEKVRKAIGNASRKARDKDVKKLALSVDHFAYNNLDLKELSEAVVQGLLMGSFQILKYKTKNLDKFKKLDEVTIFTENLDDNVVKKGTKSGEIIAQAVNLSRDLAWGPANYITPTMLAKEAEKIAKDHGIKTTIFDRKKSKEIGLTSFLAVAQGTEEPPKFIIMDYGSEKENVDTIALIGKAITFDTGGISLKPSKDMGAMKADMTGGAVVIGIMKAIAQLKPNVRVVGLVPATDNMPSGKAYHPADIITSYDGQTIEVISTDAEGRMIINDALAYAAKNYDPVAMIDFATLTGSMFVALGNYALGYFSSDEDLALKFQEASKTSGEKVWRMPLWEDYDEELKSDIADMKHTGSRGGGAISAARFLSNFVGEVPWIHCDIAGYASSNSDKGYNPKGSKGPAVRLIVDLIRNW